jgi:hypothetical protein
MSEFHRRRRDFGIAGGRDSGLDETALLRRACDDFDDTVTRLINVRLRALSEERGFLTDEIRDRHVPADVLEDLAQRWFRALIEAHADWRREFVRVPPPLRVVADAFDEALDRHVAVGQLLLTAAHLGPVAGREVLATVATELEGAEALLQDAHATLDAARRRIRGEGSGGALDGGSGGAPDE